MVHFNENFTFSDGPGAANNTFDLESLAVHEIEHMLGLLHNDDRNASMFAYFDVGEIRGLNSDDIQGIKDLYGL